MDKKLFAEWMTHLGVCTGRPVDKAVLTSYYLELKELTADELAEAVRLLVATWTDIGFPKVYHIRQAAAKTKSRRARDAVRVVRQLDLQGYDLTQPNVRGYVAWRVRDAGDGDTARAILALPLGELLVGAEEAAVDRVRRVMDSPTLPQLREGDRPDPRMKALTAGIGDGPAA